MRGARGLEDDAAPALFVVTRTRGYRHGSIVDGLVALEGLSGRLGLGFLHASEDADLGCLGSAGACGVPPGSAPIVVLLSTTGDFLSDAETEALDEHVRTGGALLGLHAATDAETDTPAYGALLGAWFARHPATQPARVRVVTPAHPAVQGVPLEITRTDEWYDFTASPVDTTVLLVVDEASYDGGGMGDPHPVAWAHERGAGRVFYTAMGHTPESFTEPYFVSHLEAALRWLSEPRP